MPKNIDKLHNEDQKKMDPNYWRSFEELYGNKDLINEKHNEFKDGVTDEFNPGGLSGLSRRKFLALLGASAAIAGTGCADYRDKGAIVPYTRKPEEITVGKAAYYASTLTSCPCGCGVLIKTREGRPIKIDGNPDHPVNKGKICLKAQASVLSLYDPERLASPKKKNGNGDFSEQDWIDVDAEIINELQKSGNKEIAIFTGKIISPTTLKTLQDFQTRFPSARIYSYELINDEVRNSAFQNSNVYPLIKWNEAKIIVSLESDFLGTEGNCVENSRLFTEGRDVTKTDDFNRLYVIEGNLSLTGMNADYRLRLRPDAQYELVTALLNSFGQGGGNSLESFAKKYGLSSKTLKYLADDLRKYRGRAIVTAGRNLPGYVHSAVNNLNETIGASNLYRTDSSEFVIHSLSSREELENLVRNMNAGNVGTVIHFNSNPIYSLPSDYGYEEALKKVNNIITLTELENETSFLSHYVLPINHDLESWNDVKTRSGFYSLQQPVISPIYNTRQKEAILLNWMGGNAVDFNEIIYLDYLRNRWENEVFPASDSPNNFKSFWNLALHDGVVLVNESVQDFTGNSSPSNQNQNIPEVSGYAVNLKESYTIGDGRWANNGWLQEIPHPVSKITWDNYAAISHATAKELDVEMSDMVEVSIRNRKLELPVFIQPGAADKTITIELGYGRSKSGVVGSDVGFNAVQLISKENGLTPYLYTSANVKKIEGKYNVVTAQEHHVFDNELLKDAAQRRGIIREGTLENYKENPKFLHEGKGHDLHTLYPEYQYTGIKWGMAIDMNKCTGCAACVVSCVAENNIPVVGKDQVEKGREMHWIRVDRYYSGTADEPIVSNQVMLCQHCDHAPCENVCPVVATTHSPDGLNQMIYNRCVGTRYCSNNCPYKVRRFNFYDFREHFQDGYQEKSVFNLIYNPEVTVRSRGVMEKCTFCIQRIMEEREDAIRDNRALKGSDVTTACQDACPTSAIKFGDINAADSEFAKYRTHELGYYVLEEINTRPNVTYLAKLRNTHTEEV